EYLSISQDAIRQSLAIDQRQSNSGSRRLDSRVRSFAPEHTFPSKTQFAWLAGQMIRWRYLCSSTDAFALAEQCAETSIYREVAGSFGIDCPAGDFPPMPLRNGGWFNAPE